jgi:hypothetical protein
MMSSAPSAAASSLTAVYSEPTSSRTGHRPGKVAEQR